MEQKSSMRILSLGMSRTGTASMKEALKILGHRHVHHAYELYTRPEQSRQWLAAWNEKIASPDQISRHTDWNSLLEGYSAVTDMPAVCFAEELIDAFPDAKVVLVKRDEKAWFESFNTGVINTYFDNAPVTQVLSCLDPELIAPVHALWTRLFATKDGYFSSTTRESMRRNAIDTYRAHNAKIIASTPPSRLLEFDLADGWEPLCSFLSANVPSVPFPRVNEGDAIKDVVAAFVSRSLLRAVRNVSIGIAILAAGVSYYFILGQGRGHF